MKKKLARAVFIMAALVQGHVQAQQLQKIWETEPVIKVPESVLFDKDARVLYVSQIEGKGNEKDGVGSIARLSPDGKITDAGWITGLNAPKGLGRHNGKLYIADLDELVIADIRSGKVLEKIKVEGAAFLNDITVDSKGTVYISDSNTGQIHAYQGGKVTRHFKSPTRPNGLLAVGNDLLILDSGSLLRLDAAKNLTTLAQGMEKSTDGIEQVSPGTYIVSAWIGVVYLVTDKGDVRQLLDTREIKSNTADIGYDAKKKIVYIPTFNYNTVAAYQLK